MLVGGVEPGNSVMIDFLSTEAKPPCRQSAVLDVMDVEPFFDLDLILIVNRMLCKYHGEGFTNLMELIKKDHKSMGE